MNSRRLLSSLVSPLAVCFIALAALLLLVSGLTNAQGSTRYVALTGTDIGTCTSLSYPCRTIQYAVDQAANDGDIIKVASGLYTDINSYGGLAQVVYISKGLTIRGGYTDTFSEPPDAEANPTTIDAQQQGRAIYATGPVSITMEGLCLAGGDATGLWSDLGENAGGGLYVTEVASLRLVGNDITSNFAQVGAGLVAYHSNIELQGNTIASNWAVGQGGGFFILGLNDTAVSLIHNSIVDNLAFNENTTPLTGNGGAGAVMGGRIVIEHNTFSGNRAPGVGGALVLGNLGQGYPLADVTLSNNHFVNNAASGGGALLAGWISGSIDSNTIISNSAAYGTQYSGRGGGIWLRICDDLLIANNIIADNSAPQSGGAIDIEGSSVELAFNTIVRNDTGNGSGVFVTEHSLPIYSEVVLMNTIIASQTIGIYIASGNSASLDSTLWGVGLWDNYQDWYVETGGNFSSVRDSWGNPAFANPNMRDYHITRSSLAINHGVDAGITIDIDGQPRPSGTGYDIGADECWWQVYLPLVLRGAP